VKIGEGYAGTISPDDKWVVTESTNGVVNIVPIGAGEARQLTHDNVRYTGFRFLPDGKQLLAVGIEPGHGGRDYVIDVATGNSKPLTPEGTSGLEVSHDGRNVAVTDSNGKLGIWSMDGSGFRPIPNAESKYQIIGWSADETSLLATEGGPSGPVTKVYRVNVVSGKVEYWNTFGEGVQSGSFTGPPHFSADGNAYAYVYRQLLSNAYVVKNLK
jgi:WD40 repeat protein